MSQDDEEIGKSSSIEQVDKFFVLGTWDKPDTSYPAGITAPGPAYGVYDTETRGKKYVDDTGESYPAFNGEEIYNLLIKALKKCFNKKIKYDPTFTTTRKEIREQIQRAWSNLKLVPPSEYVIKLIEGTSISYTGDTLSFDAPSVAKGNEEYKTIIDKLMESLKSVVGCYFGSDDPGFEAVKYTLPGFEEASLRETLKNAAAEKNAAAAAAEKKAPAAPAEITKTSGTEVQPTTSFLTTDTSFGLGLGVDIVNELVKIFGEQNRLTIRQKYASELVNSKYKVNSDVLNYVLQFVKNVKQVSDDGKTQIEAHDVLRLIQRIPQNDGGSYCAGLKLFKSLMTTLTTLTTEITGFEFTIPTGTMNSLNRSVRSCDESSSSVPSSAGGGSKSRRRHRRKHARKTRRGRGRKSKAKPKTHRRRRHSRLHARKHKKYTSSRR